MRRSLWILVVMAALLPVAAAGASGHVEQVLAFDPSAGEFPEGIAVDKRGNLYISFPFRGEIRKIAPDGTESFVAGLDPGSGLGPLGLAVDAPGNVYVAHATFDPATQGVYRIGRGGGSSERLAGTGAILFPNGVALDKRGNVYATDSVAGAVWRIPSGGAAELWFQDELLVGDGSFGFGFPIGANGIAYRQGSVYVGNSERARVVRIPVRPNGTAGSLEVIAEDPALFGADGIAFDAHGNLYAAVIAQSTLVRVAPDGGIATLATAADGLDFASSLAFGTGRSDRKSLFLVNFAIGPPGGAGPALLEVAVGFPGQPLP